MFNLFWEDMQKKIAIIQFPGTNCEMESLRAVKKTGLEAEFFRWNDRDKKISAYDGYVIPGGFSYEDRIRSAAVAARDPLILEIKKEIETGKPVLGICNGAQILVESGLIPGFSGYLLAMALAWNERGYLNIPTWIKNTASCFRSAFNGFPKDYFFPSPVAHGEGRFVIPKDVLEELIRNDQIIFTYCSSQGEIIDRYPYNPNGSVCCAAGVCNPSGNVLALMPHPERTSEGGVVFQSLKEYLEQPFSFTPKVYSLKNTMNESIEIYEKPKKSMEIFSELIITDNEAQTMEMALKNMGIQDARVRRFGHWEILSREQGAEWVSSLIDSGEILNVTKEIPYIGDPSFLDEKAHLLLVRFKDDFIGRSKQVRLVEKLGFDPIQSLKSGVLWEVRCSSEDWEKVLKSHILWNPYSQSVFEYSILERKDSQKEISLAFIREHLGHVLTETRFPGLGKKSKGKVRDIYDDGKEVTVITTDRQSAFDRVLASVPFKGQVLNQISVWWFEKTKSIIPNYVLEVPDPNVIIGKKCEVFPFEVIVRGYLTGSTSTSAWVHYEKGERNLCGNVLPEGMKKNEAFPKAIITPTTKFEKHDRNLFPREIIDSGMATEEEWNTLVQKSLELFELGQKIALSRGLILVDTKYEFGKDREGQILLIDEIHTPDSSRYWLLDSYEERFQKGQEPENVDKEFLRFWFKENCDPYGDDVLPEAPPELVAELSRRYIELYEKITGESFVYYKESIDERLKNHLLTEVGILAGSEKDLDWARKIKEKLNQKGILSCVKVLSAHKVPEKVIAWVNKNNQKKRFVYVTIAGRSNGLSGMVASSSIHPVIACPPFKDQMDMMVNIHSTLQMPSRVPVLAVLDPGNAALACQRILGLGDRAAQSRISLDIENMKSDFDTNC